MTGTLIDGKASAAKLREKIAAEAARLKAAHGLVPGLATVLVGHDPASEVYVRNKGKTAEALGFKYAAAGPMVRSSYRAGELFLKSALEEQRKTHAATASAAGSA